MTLKEIFAVEIMDFDAIPPAQESEAQAVHVCFTPLGWQAIALAQSEALSSLQMPGRLALAMGSLFGDLEDARLLDQPLEMLRRISVQLWHGQQPPKEELLAFSQAGFTRRQLGLLWNSIQHWRSRPAVRQRATWSSSGGQLGGQRARVAPWAPAQLLS